MVLLVITLLVELFIEHMFLHTSGTFDVTALATGDLPNTVDYLVVAGGGGSNGFGGGGAGGWCWCRNAIS